MIFKEILQGAATSKQRKLYEEENKECHENLHKCQPYL